MRFRDDKPQGNHKSVVDNIIKSILEGVEKEDVRAFLRHLLFRRLTGTCLATVHSFSHDQMRYVQHGRHGRGSRPTHLPTAIAPIAADPLLAMDLAGLVALVGDLLLRLHSRRVCQNLIFAMGHYRSHNTARLAARARSWASIGDAWGV